MAMLAKRHCRSFVEVLRAWKQDFVDIDSQQRLIFSPDINDIGDVIEGQSVPAI
jgi:hypothetical protein